MLLLNILLALVWVALTADFEPTNFIVGFILSYLLLGLLQRTLGTSDYFTRVRSTLVFILFFLWELLLANLRVAVIVLSPRLRVRPGIVAIQLDAVTPGEITLLANLITLTPGTLSLDVSTDRRVLYVHGLNIDDVERFRQEIKRGFEARILEVMR
jgi:multicomponent Na+:H+ antiporter subunit E